MPSYSAEFKEQVVRKLMPPHNQTVAAVSRETGISQASLYNWKKQFRAKGFIVPKKSTQADQWDAKAKLTAVIQTAAIFHRLMFNAPTCIHIGQRLVGEPIPFFFLSDPSDQGLLDDPAA